MHVALYTSWQNHKCQLCDDSLNRISRIFVTLTTYEGRDCRSGKDEDKRLDAIAAGFELLCRRRRARRS